MRKLAATRFLVVVVVLTATGESAAQTTATSLHEVVRSRLLSVGDGIYITDIKGRRLKGHVRSVSSAALEVTDGRTSWSFAETELLNVERQDPLRNGALTGIAVGVGVAVAACTLGGSGECAYSNILYGYPAIAFGGFLGTMIDAVLHRTVVDLSGRSSMKLAPVISDRGIGARVAAVW